MTSKFRYVIFPDNIYTLDFGNGKKIDESGENILNVLWSHYKDELLLSDKINPQETDKSSDS